ncbi:hypothetical protein AB0873_09455 [Micromonospora sp. NPDC047707]|uniref:hypothetical protein n=1 Tax=Micromonospora sp. NPDC047707 TaxID=3154498 RepID=UPI003454E488
MSRRERWWRPQPAVRRPGQRSRTAGRRHVDRATDDAFDIGYQAGQADAQQASENRDRQLRRIIDAILASEQGDPGPLAELSREAGREDLADGLLEVADAAGVTPLADVDGGQLVDQVERWLRGRDGDA